MTESELRELTEKIKPADPAAMQAARERQAKLAKPPGSLGGLEEMSIRMAGATGQTVFVPERFRVLVFAADNGIVEEGVSVTPQSVTLSQSVNMLRHVTGMSALAKHFGDSVVVTDVGIRAPFVPEGIAARSVRRGTGNFLKGPAMSRSECLRAVEAGVEAAKNAAADGINVIGIGEMGIGNTTTSAAVLAALTGLPAEAVAGRGGGLTDAAFKHKKEVIEAGLKLHRPDPADVIGVLSAVGGLDIAAMCGAFLGAALCGMPAAADGYISVVAALCAVRLCPAARDYIFLSHCSAEPGYRKAAEALGLKPCLDLSMRLGEGSGCVLLFRILEAAGAVMSGMATFEEAAINDSYLDEIRKLGGGCGSGGAEES